MPDLTCPCAVHGDCFGCGDGYTMCRGHVCQTEGPRQTDLRRLFCQTLDNKVTPILHNHGVVILQFNGWSVNLHEDGTWIWEATDG